MTMSAALDAVLRDAMLLDPIERAELLHRLFVSFDSAADETIDREWRWEAEDRVAAFPSGKIPADSADDVFKRLARR